MAGAILTSGCGELRDVVVEGSAREAGPSEGRLTARPRQRPAGSGQAGLHPLGLGGRRDGLVFAPTTHRHDARLPLVVMLHGAGGDARRALDPFLGSAEEKKLVLVAPESRGRSWDVILGGFGPDVAFIDRALEKVFGEYAIAPGKVAIEGFSDGASYALSLGLTNGDLFRKIVAFSPGFSAPGRPRGSPEIFVSHGVKDTVLPIGATSREVVPTLEDAGYPVEYVEFEGGHGHPGDVERRALAWLLHD